MNVTVLVMLAAFAAGVPDQPEGSALKNLLGEVGGGFSSLLSWELLPQALAIAGATGASTAADDDVEDYFTGVERLGGAGDVVSNAAVLGAGFGTVIVTGWLSENSRNRSMSYDLMQGLLMANAVAYAIKLPVQRERPDGGNFSFPSGHAANTFTFAGILAHHYGWKVGVPLHALAALVSLSRLDLESHWLSDTVAGAGLGLLVAHAVVRKSGLPSPSPNLSWVPVFPRGGMGVQFSWRWGPLTSNR